jgi:mRNA interferase RelE/StbE
VLKIAYSNGALRALRRLPFKTAALIRSKIGQYATNPAALANNVIRLKGSPYLRLRVGDWRVIFEVSGGTLMVLDAGHRSSIYDD